MGHKGKPFLVLLVLLFFLSLACNAPRVAYCEITGGYWVDEPWPGGCVRDDDKIPIDSPTTSVGYPTAAVPVPVEETMPSVETVEPSTGDPTDAPQPAEKADIGSCITYDLALKYVNVLPTTTNRYTACDAQLALNSASNDPIMVVWHLIYDNDPAKGPEEVWKQQILEPGEAVILVDDLFTSKWNNGEYYYRKVLEIAALRYIPECEHFYIDTTYQEPPTWFAEAAKPLDEFSCP